MAKGLIFVKRTQAVEGVGTAVPERKKAYLYKTVPKQLAYGDVAYEEGQLVPYGDLQELLYAQVQEFVKPLSEGGGLDEQDTVYCRDPRAEVEFTKLIDIFHDSKASSNIDEYHIVEVD